MARANVFVSYSHKDERFKDELLTHLRLLERQGLVSIWHEGRISAGADWTDEIQNAINKADVALLLISPDYLASDFVVERELPALLQRARERGTLVLPILIRAAPWTTVPELAQFQFLNEAGKPLASARDRDEAFSRVAQKLYDVVSALGARSDSATTTSRPTESATPSSGAQRRGGDPHVFVSHSKIDGDFAELLKHRLEQIGLRTWIDTDRLDPGVDWRQEIDESLRTALAVVAVMSPDARSSEYVTYEWAFAWGTKKDIIPIMLRETPLHPRLATLQYLDFTNRNARPWPRLYDALRKLQNGT